MSRRLLLVSCAIFQEGTPSLPSSGSAGLLATIAENASGKPGPSPLSRPPLSKRRPSAAYSIVTESGSESGANTGVCACLRVPLQFVYVLLCVCAGVLSAIERIEQAMGVIRHETDSVASDAESLQTFLSMPMCSSVSFYVVPSASDSMKL